MRRSATTREELYYSAIRFPLTGQTRGVVRVAMATAGIGAALARLSLLPLTFADAAPLDAWEAPLRLALTHRLTLYDARYLDLALAMELPLATLDRELRAAAAAERVPLLPA